VAAALPKAVLRRSWWDNSSRGLRKTRSSTAANASIATSISVRTNTCPRTAKDPEGLSFAGKINFNQQGEAFFIPFLGPFCTVIITEDHIFGLQNRLFVPVRPGKQVALLKKFFKKQGADVFESSAKEHDEMLSVVQGMTHFVHLASASAVRTMAFDLRKSRRFSSPVYKVFSCLMARVALQNPALYAGIQLENPSNKKARKAFLSEAKKLDGLVSAKSRRQVEKWIERCAGAFQGGLGEELLEESDRALRAVEGKNR